VPVGGYHARMCGKLICAKVSTPSSAIAVPVRECDSFVAGAGTGKHGQKCVAAVSIGMRCISVSRMGETLLLSFAWKHGNEHQVYRFNNEAQPLESLILFTSMLLNRFNEYKSWRSSRMYPINQT
jgi:hypothetical protein